MRNYIPDRTVDILLQLVCNSVNKTSSSLSRDSFLKAVDLRHVLKVCRVKRSRTQTMVVDAPPSSQTLEQLRAALDDCEELLETQRYMADNDERRIMEPSVANKTTKHAETLACVLYNLQCSKIRTVYALYQWIYTMTLLLIQTPCCSDYALFPLALDAHKIDKVPSLSQHVSPEPSQAGRHSFYSDNVCI